MSVVTENPAAWGAIVEKALYANDRFSHHVLSAAKEGVRKDTTLLARSLRFAPSELHGTRVEAVLHDGVAARGKTYGAAEELGNTWHGPHAFLMPAAEQEAPKAAQITGAAFGVAGYTDPGDPATTEWDAP